ncbi:MAG: ribonuclease III [Negativicutes bacterium]|nr:ribonuclease III [Negativicutes bacterium]
MEETALQQALGLPVKAAPLLRRALWHNSAIYEAGLTPLQGNERLEFLGDAVVELAVSRWLYETYPASAEGEMTALRAALVCEESLSACARRLGLGQWIKLGRGEREDGGAEKPAILGDLMEAVLGAVLLEYGFEQADRIIRRELLQNIDPFCYRDSLTHSWKNRLQELTQGNGISLKISYTTEKTGPDHAPLFLSHVFLGEDLYGEGEGKSKKESEQAAARSALTRLQRQLNQDENAGRGVD